MERVYKLKIYLDNCCLNRPYDDQTQIRISLETDAKLFIQSLIVERRISFVWSFILFYENSLNPYEARRDAILNFSRYADQKVFVVRYKYRTLQT
jgi:hypothetical protein